MRNRSYQFGKSQLTIEFGDITSAKTQVIVSSDDCYITMGGGVSASILRAGGQEIMIDAAKKVPAKLGDVIVTTAGRLRAQYIFHAITLEQYADQIPARQVGRNSVTRCFELLDAFGLESIAFPAIGAGVARFSYDDVAVEMADVIAARLAGAVRPLRVSLFLFDRFGRMQPIDFIRFFEEFARRRPEIGDHEVTAPVLSVAQVLAPVVVNKPTGMVARQQELRLKLNELTEERTRLEEQLARMGVADVDESRRTRMRLTQMAEERIPILAELQRAQARPVSVFISYSHADQKLREELEKHLIILRRQGVIETWHDRKITAGTEWRDAIDEHLISARLILLLISPDFMASDYCYETEMQHALQRHESRQARVVPVILREVMWDKAPFAKLAALPTDGKAVKTWEISIPRCSKGYPRGSSVYGSR
jgi:O-acetyl-ADP-ribose deacetylase (regulator of RNase III)/flagellar basal body-associated protein FliL